MPSSSLLLLRSSSCLKRALLVLPTGTAAVSCSRFSAAASQRRTAVLAAVRQFSSRDTTSTGRTAGVGKAYCSGNDRDHDNDDDDDLDTNDEEIDVSAEGAAQQKPRAKSYNGTVQDIEYLLAEPALPEGLNPYRMPDEPKKPNPAHMAPPLRPLPHSKPRLVIFPDEQQHRHHPRNHDPLPRPRSIHRPVIFPDEEEDLRTLRRQEYYHHRTMKNHDNRGRYWEQFTPDEHRRPHHQQHQQHTMNYDSRPWKQTTHTVADYLMGQSNGIVLPTSAWIQISAIPPASSLESMLEGVDRSLDALCASSGGLIDLDAQVVFDHQNQASFPFLPEQPPVQESTTSSSSRWVQKARLRLSPFGRPNGWLLQLPNRSVAYALAEYSKITPLKCAWKVVHVQPCYDNDEPINEAAARGGLFVDDISDCTVRMEQVDPSIRAWDLTKIFSRFDLSNKHREPIVPWEQYYHKQGHAPLAHPKNGRNVPVPRNSVYLVYFASPAWARAAVREQQGLLQGGKCGLDRKILKLAQYPRQIL